MSPNIHTRFFIVAVFVLALGAIYSQTDKPVSFKFSQVSSFKLFDVNNNQSTTITSGNKPLLLFVFLSPECPLCQNYTKTLRELQERFKQQVNLIGIVPGNAYTASDVSAFEKKYNIGFRLFIDSSEQLTHYLQATVTPQVVLINNKGNLIYTGAIDDWIQSLGKKRLQVSQYYAKDAIEQSLNTEIVKIEKTNAIGCKINDY